MPASSTLRAVRRKPEPFARRRPGKKAKAAKCAARHASHDFLKQTFLPVTHFEGYRKNKSSLLEEQFFQSVTNLTTHYKISQPEVCSEPFPYNMLSVFQHVKKSMESLEKEVTVLISEKEDITTLATVEEIGISYTIYYVPLNALDWMHSQGKKQTFLLLLSLYAYIHQTVRMPLPGDNDYLNNCFDSIDNWLDEGKDEYDDEELKRKLTDIKEMKRKQPILERAVRDNAHLVALSDRINAYKPGTKPEKDLHIIAQKIFHLQQQYPSNHFYQNFHHEHREDNDDDYRAYPDQYFSFFWDDNGWLYESVIEYINCDLQECNQFDQPASIHYFNQKDSKPESDLDFEKRLLDLLNELSSVTYQLIR